MGADDQIPNQEKTDGRSLLEALLCEVARLYALVVRFKKRTKTIPGAFASGKLRHFFKQPSFDISDFFSFLS